MATEIVTRFTKETANHEMTVLHDDGLYRHLRFTPSPQPGKPRHSFYWFDLITVPGALIFQGDGDSFTFRRVEDMFEFFRGPIGQINPGYWAEKLTSGRNENVREYQQGLLEQHVNEYVNEAIDDDNGGVLPEFAGLTDAIREHILDELIGDESIDRKLVEDFRWWANPDDEFAIPRKSPDFEFTDVWEWDFRDYDWWFLWALHGIVWGIAQYDARTTAQPAPGVVDVQLPEPADSAAVA
jgi:hypothetical protein